LIVGVTGGYGAGKSTVCSFFEEAGRLVLSADAIAASLIDSDRGVQKKLKETFGTRVFRPDGTLDRQVMASLVFGNPERLAKLNSITHPPVMKVLRRSIRDIPPRERLPFIAVESALIFEAGLSRYFDAVVVVYASLPTRLKRLSGSVGKQEALRRIRMQISPAQAIRMADFAISNQGPKSALRKKVRLISRILASPSFNASPSRNFNLFT
jgi:dephospho-CoA kinase